LKKARDELKQAKRRKRVGFFTGSKSNQEIFREVLKWGFQGFLLNGLEISGIFDSSHY